MMSKEIKAKEGMTEEQKSKAELKAQRKALFEAQRQTTQMASNEKISENKSKSEMKAERRAKQELQRMTKSGLKQNVGKVESNNKVIDKSVKTIGLSQQNQVQDMSQINNTVIEKTSNLNETKMINASKVLTSNTSTNSLAKRGQIFSHIPKRTQDITLLNESLKLNVSIIPPIVIKIGLKFNRNFIKGSNARCVGMLLAFKTVIREYVTPPSKELLRDLESNIDSYVKFLAKCRPLSISMNNAVKNLKFAFSRIPAETSDYKAKQILCDSIDMFIEDEIICAQRGIAELAITKVNDENDVILTFGCSLIVKHVLYNAAKKGKKFRVIVVDSRPRFDGKEMLKYLLQQNIPVTYIYINAVSYIMKEVTKVLLGAHSLLANGYVMSHIGSSQIALVANAYNVPVLVCCETYKFSERVHTDSFVHNELGDSTDFLNALTPNGKSQIEQIVKGLNILDLLYDVTPHEFVSVVITEKGILPCTSAPAVLRVRETK